MNNTIIPKSEREKMEEIISLVKDFVEHHSEVKPNLGAENRLERIHTVLYLDIVGDLVRSAKTLEDLLTATEEEFTNIITKNGEKTLEEVERMVMMKAMANVLGI